MPFDASAIRVRVEVFASELTALMNAAAVEAVEKALRTGDYTRQLRRPHGRKRPAAAIAALTEELDRFIRNNPGLRVEQIGKALGITTRELELPIKRLHSARRIRVKGHKRATRYHPATASSTSAGGSKGTSKTTTQHGRTPGRPPVAASGRSKVSRVATEMPA